MDEPSQVNQPTSLWWGLPRLLVAIVLCTASVGHLLWTVRFRQSVPPLIRQAMRLTAPFQAVSHYGPFASMTTTRPELVIEGSQDGVTWREYPLRFKPGSVNQAPRWNTPPSAPARLAVVVRGDGQAERQSLARSASAAHPRRLARRDVALCVRPLPRPPPHPGPRQPLPIPLHHPQRAAPDRCLLCPRKPAPLHLPSRPLRGRSVARATSEQRQTGAYFVRESPAPLHLL